MITAVDTNILLDYLNPAEIHNEKALQRLLEVGEEGALVICEATYAELAASFETHEDLTGFLETAGIDLLRCDEEALFVAGRAWLLYSQQRPVELQCAACGSLQTVRCARCGNTIRARQHVLSDFLIGAQAQTQADQLLTWDTSYYRTYFPDLRLA